ncbi:MAG: hypothetical protein ABS76_36305 [Pelagibacterium sp. SCN 64-44]|nr:MAG: hypothetical protein ABS76_36305 [Pelagibacterium sp. SCN 64-44]
MLELAAIWTIIALVLVWFWRDEQARRRQRLLVRARYYATAPSYRHRGPALPPLPTAARPRGGLSASQRKFLENWRDSRR